ncbi:DNA primase, partial [Vibrio anguillarum]|nr:DNA primase [Vibrio anguillarum]
KGLNLLKSGMGTGKSTTVQKFIRQNPQLKTLIVSHRRALAKSLRTSINDESIQVEYYEDLIIKDSGKGIDANMALRSANILVCSVDSLHRLAGSRWDAVFVDEIEQNLSHYFAETNRFGEHCL